MVNQTKNRVRTLSDDYLSILVGLIIIALVFISYHLTGSSWSAVKFSSWSNLSQMFSNLFTLDFLLPYFMTYLILATLVCLGNYLQQKASVLDSIKAFTGVYLIASLVYLISAQITMKQYLEYAFWALVIGLIFSTLGWVPEWIKPALKSDYYIKIGLVLMGSEIIFSNLTKFGAYGIAIVLLVVPATMFFMWWFGTKWLKMEDEKQVMVLTTATSVCGVSAAVACASAIDADKEDLSYTISITSLFTIFMMVAMPYLIEWMGLSELVGGAWIGNTVDSTGAVVLAGESVGPIGSQVAAMIKMIQNLLIGVIVVILSIYFSKKDAQYEGERVGVGEIWRRMPKFVIAFILVSLVFSFIVGPLYGMEQTNDFISSIGTWKGWFFCLTFLSIGMETDLRSMIKELDLGKPVALYVTGQTFSVILSLIVCWFLLSGRFFPLPQLAGLVG